MKRKISAILAMLMTFTIAAPSALAVSPTNDEEEMQTITTGYEVYYTDENGNLVLEEEGSSTEEIPVPNPKSRLLTDEVTNYKSFVGATLILKAQFNYEAGYSVSVRSRSGTTTMDSSWTKLSDGCTTTSGTTWCRVTYKAKIQRKQDLLERTYNVWIECSRSGHISKG